MNNAYIRAQQCKVKEAKFPFVKIGTQYWTTKNLSLAATPQGNTIPEVQANGNVEKITNAADREFSSDTGFWIKADSTITIVDNVCHFLNTPTIINLRNNTLLIANKYYKVTFTISNYISGSVAIIAGSTLYTTRNGNGTFTEYVQASNTPFYLSSRTNGTTLDIDNVSAQEIGWSGSQELYDGIYAQTSGTVEQKTYAACKAAAMWCHYNNSVDNGAIYGKLYNWFAVKLFQMDIDYYNAANPTTPWGWRVPTQAEFQALSTYLGGDAVSGGKMKVAGTTYWNSPNTGADNSSGFTALGGGYRDENVGFTSINKYSRFAINTSGIRMLLDNSSTNCTIGMAGSSLPGISVRFIKA